MEKRKFEAGDGTVVEPTDFRLAVGGKLEVSVDEMPDPKDEVTITLKGTVQSIGLKAMGPQGRRYWSLEAGVLAHTLSDVRIGKPDPTLWDAADDDVDADQDGDDG